MGTSGRHNFVFPGSNERAAPQRGGYLIWLDPVKRDQICLRRIGGAFDRRTPEFARWIAPGKYHRAIPFENDHAMIDEALNMRIVFLPDVRLMFRLFLCCGGG